MSETAATPPHSATTPPSPWVARFAPLARPGGTALDLACGGGRHGRLLRDSGMRVAFVDRDVSGLDDLLEDPESEIIETDLESGNGFPLAGRRFDCVVVTNYLWRPIMTAVLDTVAPGGLLVYETFGTGNERYGRPSNPDFLLRPGELREAVAGAFAILAYEHGERTDPSPAVIQRIAAVRC